MILFINERSFAGQLHPNEDVNAEFREFSRTLESFFRSGSVSQFYYDRGSLLLRGPVAGEVFAATLKRLTDQSLRSLILEQIYNRGRFVDWRRAQKHNENDTYILANDLCVGDSLAELARRCIDDVEVNGVVLNFRRSSFSNLLELEIVNIPHRPVVVFGFEEHDVAENWLSALSPVVRYTDEADYSPLDAQTILRDSKRFLRTSRQYDGRCVYKESETRRYWYVDNLHVGVAAHLEVFSEVGQHLGEATLDGAIDSDKRDPRKRYYP